MTSSQLWAPWRSEYVTADKKDIPKDSCFMCQYLSESNDAANLIVRRNPHTFVIMNRYPYNNGHLLIAPLAHKATLAELNDDELLEIQKQLTQMCETLQAVIKPEGFNIGVNLGKVAGAGLPGHIHWHIVPRWNGDTNFMSVTADTRVIVQSLAELHRLLTEQLSK